MILHLFLFLLLSFLILYLARLCHLYLLHHCLPPQEQERCIPWFTVSSSPAIQAIVLLVVFPPPSQWVWGHRLCPCAPGARSKAGGEPRNARIPRASPVPTTSARTLESQTLTFMPWLGMASMVMLSRSKRFAAKPATPLSLLGATPPCTV
jgi:hypothetical protein